MRSRDCSATRCLGGALSGTNYSCRARGEPRAFRHRITHRSMYPSVFQTSYLMVSIIYFFLLTMYPKPSCCTIEAELPTAGRIISLLGAKWSPACESMPKQVVNRSKSSSQLNVFYRSPGYINHAFAVRITFKIPYYPRLPYIQTSVCSPKPLQAST